MVWDGEGGVREYLDALYCSLDVFDGECSPRAVVAAGSLNEGASRGWIHSPAEGLPVQTSVCCQLANKKVDCCLEYFASWQTGKVTVIGLLCQLGTRKGDCVWIVLPAGKQGR